MSTNELDVFLLGTHAGRLSQEKGGKHWFTYLDGYTGPALSLSMPTTSRRWGPERVEPFITGLIPDDHRVLEQIAREHDLVAGNPFSLLKVLGRDCAGAVQFLPSGQTPDMESSLRPVTEDEIADRLARISGPSAESWLAGREHWSLAGVQAKIALHRDPHTGAWSEALGAAPTTHIIKPAGPLPQHALNEVLCLRSLSWLGVPAARTELHDFGGIPAVVSARWDRRTTSTGSIDRIPQEDLCQAMHVHPRNKYASDGGPQAYEIARFLTDAAPGQRLAEQFTEALVLNVLLGNTDAHAKNYSLLRPVDGDIQLAPIYDVASVFPYDDSAQHRLAMKIGGRNIPAEIERRHWHRYADKAGLPYDSMDRALISCASRLPTAMQKAVIEMVTSSTSGPLVATPEARELISRLTAAVTDECTRVLRWF